MKNLDCATLEAHTRHDVRANLFEKAGKRRGVDQWVCRLLEDTVRDKSNS